MNMLHLQVRPGSEKARIWQICDELFAKTGIVPSGREVVDRYIAEDGNEGTGFTQYSHWKKELQSRMAGEPASAPVPRAIVPGTVGFQPIDISADGHLVLSAEIRHAMMLDGDGRATVSVVDGELRIITPLVALHQLQRRARELVAPGTVVSEELIAERRAEASGE
jgi:hypothetical protein